MSLQEGGIKLKFEGSVCSKALPAKDESILGNSRKVKEGQSSGVKGRLARGQVAGSRSQVIPGLTSQFREVGFYFERHGRHLKI